MQIRAAPLPSVLTIALISTATIATAWAFELFGGYSPCPLCLQQRWPYYAAIPIALVLIALRRRSGQGLRLGLLLIALIMLAGAALAVYHVGIEWKWWPGPQACSVATGLSGTLPDLTNARVVRCDEAPWRFLGLSFAGWNLVMSLLIAAIALNSARQKSA
jgi:disulfide bond formation protein DsbB